MNTIGGQEIFLGIISIFTALLVSLLFGIDFGIFDRFFGFPF